MVFVFGALLGIPASCPNPARLSAKRLQHQILDRNGKLLYDLYDEERRKPVAIDQVPEHLKHAVIATEDKDFYKHEGFDFMTIVAFLQHCFPSAGGWRIYPHPAAGEKCSAD